ncbi:MAG: hypothetical protein M1354_01360 [Candidatus Marsarchaeota archaeon]|jgi:hypothetical protein|nr:hypothetical protein [Candidatus Marsarchaeota archaeon]
MPGARSKSGSHGSLRLYVLAIAAVIAAILLIAYHAGAFGLLQNLSYLLNPPQGLTLGAIIIISFILGMMHGATPDEHTWPITFSYAIGSYSTKKGMKAGFAFSAGFSLQRAFLTTIGFLGLAVIYKQYNLDGPVYMIVGAAMVLAGAYVLNKKMYLHLPFDLLLHGGKHHTEEAERIPLHEAHLKPVKLKMAVAHGLIAGFGFGAYATIIVFILAPQVPGLIYAPLPGLFFGLGTMVMQIIFGAVFANMARLYSLKESEMIHVGSKTAGRTLYYGGMAFAVIGLLIIAFPFIDAVAISTGNPIPNLSSIGVATLLVLVVVGVIGIGNLIASFAEMARLHKHKGPDKKAP